ncbi:HEPN domain-containing protein [Methanocella sp. MCL-LM]|uniref:HEPN domain-containing protein n=1 Tax=Methanocella sp. MCL-LM TaxID=3412035 RepID=UPI003C781C1B
MRTLDDCYKKGLKRIDSDTVSARNCLISAASHLDDAEASFSIKRYRLTLTSSYEAIFHAAKALLFKDGVKEHSHICVPVYLREAHPELEEYANTLDSYRLYREKATYGFGVNVSEAEAKAALENAKLIIEKMQALI